MAIPATYSHTNLIARDWRALAAFYERVFGCIPVPPERDLRGDALERGSRVPGATLTGVHLRLPRLWDERSDAGDLQLQHPHRAAAANRPGFGHVAFAVPDVVAARAAVLAGGGSQFGDVVTTPAGNPTAPGMERSRLPQSKSNGASEQPDRART